MSASSRVAVMLDDKVLVSSAESDLTMVEGSESHLYADLGLWPRLMNEGSGYCGFLVHQTGTFLNKTWWIDLGSSRATRTPLAVGKVRRRGPLWRLFLTRCILCWADDPLEAKTGVASYFSYKKDDGEVLKDIAW
jgi:hypothetical protein